MELRIDQEFQSKIPPLTEEEYRQLEENILSAGEVYEPIVTWNGIIVDGHNRWKIIQKHPEVSWRTRSMDFADKWEAFDWMYKNQLGRRNLTEQQRTFLIGKMYEARKNSHGGERGNQYKNLASLQNEDMPRQKIRTEDTIAFELGIGASTVERSEKYSKGIDAIREQEPEIADSILKGELPVTKAAVMSLAKETDEPTLRHKIEMLKAGEPIRANSPAKDRDQTFEERKEESPLPVVPAEPEEPVEYLKPVYTEDGRDKRLISGTKENREMRRRIQESIDMMRNTDRVVVYTLDMMLTEMRSTFQSYTSGLKMFLNLHPEMLTKGNKKALQETIRVYLTDEIKKIEKEIKYV